MKSLVFKSMIFYALSIISCNQSNEPFMDSVAMQEVSETIESKSISKNFEGISEADSKVEPNKLKIIKNAQTRYKVKNVDEATEFAEAIVTKHDGYISDLRFQNNTRQLENRFTIRLPQEHFDKVLNELSKMALFVDYTNISTTDVSEEYIDLQTRLKTKLEVKKRYEEILRTKAKTVKEVLLAEEQLGELQEEIESAQGRLNFLTNKVALSTIQVDLYETVEHKNQPEIYIQSFGSKIIDSLSFGWNLLKNLFLGILYIWPLILLGCGIIFYLRFKRRKPKDNH